MKHAISPSECAYDIQSDRAGMFYVPAIKTVSFSVVAFVLWNRICPESRIAPIIALLKWALKLCHFPQTLYQIE